MRWLNFIGAVLIVMGVSSILSPAFAMYNGAPANSIPGVSEEVLYKALAVVVARSSDGSANSCMGVLIHRNFVSTSAHCIAKARSVEVRLFSGVRIQKPVTRNAIDWVIHEKWSDEAAKVAGDPFSFHDLGIVMIQSAPSWNQPIQVAAEYDTIKEYSEKPLYVVSREISDYSKMLPSLKVMTLKSFAHYSGADSHLYGGWVQQPGDGGHYAVCEGDSGAPVIAVDGGQPVLVGNHNNSGGALSSKKIGSQAILCHNYEIHYNISFEISFIEKAMNVLNTRNDFHISSSN